VADDRKIILTEDDFNPPAASGSAAPAAPSPPAPAAPPAPAVEPRPGGPLPPVARQAPVSVTDVPAAKRPTPTRRGPSFLYDERTSGLAAAAVGMALAWILTEGTRISDIEATTAAGAHAATGLWTGVVAVVFCGVVRGFDHAVAGAWNEAARRAVQAAVPALVVGFVAGFVASAIYLEILEGIIEDSGLDFGEHDARLYVAAALGWTVFGGGVGAVVGLLERSRDKAVNAVLGGLAGGVGGGLIVHFTLAAFEEPWLSQLLGLLGIGLLIAVAVRAVEHARREAWLRIVGGGMTGKEFILYHPVTRIGSAPECEIFLLKDPAVAPEHAVIEDRGTVRILRSAGGAVLVNQVPVTAHRLRGGDQVQIGGSTIAYSERSVPGASHE
jgi:hypothetical protein